MRIVGELPARLGSVRVKQKNLRDLNGKPMIAYAIEAAKASRLLTEFYVNTESDAIGEVALKYGARYFKRLSHLSTDEATQDQFNFDFIKKTQADYLVLVNPVCPLITGKDIDEVIAHTLKYDFDTVITTKEEKLHAFCADKAINFNPQGMLPRTQDLAPIQICAWAVSVWKAQPFIKSFEENGYASFVGKVGFYPIAHTKAVKISTETDFKMAELLLQLEEKNV